MHPLGETALRSWIGTVRDDVRCPRLFLGALPFLEVDLLEGECSAEPAQHGSRTVRLHGTGDA